MKKTNFYNYDKENTTIRRQAEFNMFVAARSDAVVLLAMLSIESLFLAIIYHRLWAKHIE